MSVPLLEETAVAKVAFRKDSPESPCTLRTKGQHDRGQAGPAAILPDGCLQHPEQVQGARQWLVRVIARRAVAILKAKQGEQT